MLGARPGRDAGYW